MAGNTEFFVFISYVKEFTMSLDYQEFADDKLVELTVDGKVTRAEFDEIAPKIEAFIAEHGTIKLIEVVHHFGGMEMSAMWEGIKFDRQNVKHISHCAVVSDISWISPLTKAASAFLSTKLRTFDLAELDAAREWIGNPGD